MNLKLVLPRSAQGNSKISNLLGLADSQEVKVRKCWDARHNLFKNRAEKIGRNLLEVIL